MITSPAVINDHEKAEYTRKVKVLQNRPDIFITKIIGEETLEEYHTRICEKVVEYDRIAIKACHAVGKTWICGRLVPWFISCFPGSIVITTAPTNRQVETLLWGEIRKAVRRSKTKLGGSLINKKWTIADDWYAMGFSPQGGSAKDTGEQQGSSFQGFHAKYVLIIFDEATGISKDLYIMAEGLLTSGVIVKWICIANPTSTASEFFQICKKAEWHVMTINCFDSPNMKANGFINRAALESEIAHLKTLSDHDRLKRIKNYLKPNGHLLSAQWAVSKIYEWGFDHPLTKSKVLGEFPTSSDNVIVKWDSMQAAIQREPEYDYDKRFIGVDVARYGDDLIVLTELTEKTKTKKCTWRGKYVSFQEEISETTGRVVKLFWAGDSGKETHIGIDTTGLGAGVYSDLREMKRLGELPEHVFIHEIIYASTEFSANKEEQEKLAKHYENVKCYMFDLLNQDLRDNMSMPDEEIYQEETVNIMFKFSKKGKLLVESKDDYKGRTKKSPDHSDSLAMANYCRYLKPSYGSFKGADKSKNMNKPFSEGYLKKSVDRKVKIKVNTF
jgi:phage terminase large subunit